MIPKIIHYCWVGGNPLPELAKKCIESWKKYCPDFTIKEWNETNYDFTKNRYMREALEAGKWGFVPDYARLDIIYSYGGIYLDTDVEIIKPIDDLLAYPAFMGMERPGRVALGLGFGAEPGNALVREMMDSYEGRSFYNPNGTLDTTASPTIQSKFLAKKGLAAKDVLQQIDHAVILPSEYLCPQSPYTGKTEITGNTYSIHHYMASWMSPLDKLIFDLSRKFDKSSKSGAVLERLTTAPFRAVRTVRKKGVKGIFRKGMEKLKIKKVKVKIKSTLRKRINRKNVERLQNRDFSLIASNCNGTFILHDLGMRFNSPFINLWIAAGDFIRILKNPEHYLQCPLSFEDASGYPYPVGLLDDVKIHFTHYQSPEEARAKWEERLPRIDYDNLFILLAERDGCTYQDLAEFDRLPYKNKVVFTHIPYPEFKSAVYIKGWESEDCVGWCYEFKKGLSVKRHYDEFDYVGWFNKGQKDKSGGNAYRADANLVGQEENGVS